jgi:DNA-binding transcriptional regulator YiaG
MVIDTLPPATARDLARPLPLLLPQDVRGMRRTAGLSMSELARRVGVSVVTVRQWELGEAVPTRANVHKLLEVLMAAMADASEIRATARRLQRA